MKSRLAQSVYLTLQPLLLDVIICRYVGIVIMLADSDVLCVRFGAATHFTHKLPRWGALLKAKLSRIHMLSLSLSPSSLTNRLVWFIPIVGPSKLQRDQARDVSELIALGQPNSRASSEGHYDQRLFNQTKVTHTPAVLSEVLL